MYEMCRICLREIRDNADYNCVDDTELGLEAKLLDFVPEMDLTCTPHAVVCFECTDIVLRISEFKKLCLNIEETVRSLHLNQVSLEDILGVEMKDKFKLEDVTMTSVLYGNKFNEVDPYLDECTSNSDKATGDQPSLSKRQKHHCHFCKTYVGNFARHVLRHHMSELEVAEIAVQPTISRQRKQLLSSLRKKGNYVANNVGCLTEPQACPYCLGFYSAPMLARHKRRCLQNPSKRLRLVSAPVQPRLKKSVKRVLVPWTEHQKVAVYRHFKRNIEGKRAPSKIECERFKLEHPELMSNKNWLKIKVYVQNVYTNKNKSFFR